MVTTSDRDDLICIVEREQCHRLGEERVGGFEIGLLIKHTSLVCKVEGGPGLNCNERGKREEVKRPDDELFAGRVFKISCLVDEGMGVESDCLRCS